jgi:hypothetical protein
MYWKALFFCFIKLCWILVLLYSNIEFVSILLQNMILQSAFSEYDRFYTSRSLHYFSISIFRSMFTCLSKLRFILISIILLNFYFDFYWETNLTPENYFSLFNILGILAMTPIFNRGSLF